MREMSAIFRLGAKLNKLCWSGVVITGVMVYVFNLGEWTLSGVRIYTIFAGFLLTLLVTSFLKNLIILPALSSQTAQFAKQTVMLSEVDASTSGQAAFANEVIDTAKKLEITSHIAGAIGSVILYLFLGPRVGSPISEFAAVISLSIIPLIVTALTQGRLTRMKYLNAELYETAYGLYVSLNDSIISGRL